MRGEQQKNVLIANNYKLIIIVGTLSFLNANQLCNFTYSLPARYHLAMNFSDIWNTVLQYFPSLFLIYPALCKILISYFEFYIKENKKKNFLGLRCSNRLPF